MEQKNKNEDTETIGYTKTAIQEKCNILPNYRDMHKARKKK